MSVETTASDSRKWSAWVGDIDRMRRLASLVDELIEEPVSVSLRRLEERYSAEVAEDRAQELVPEMEANEKELGIKHTGAPDGVLDRINPDLITRTSLSVRDFRGESFRVQLDFSNPDGCTLQVSGDPGWVRKAAGTLAAEVGRSVPGWSWLRSGWGGLAYGTVVALITLTLILPTLPFKYDNGEPQSVGDTVFLVIIVCAFVGFFGGFALYGVARKVLPGYELLLSGQTGGKGGRVVVFLGGQLVALVLAFLLSRF